MQNMNRDVLSNILTFSNGDHIFHASTSKMLDQVSKTKETEFISESRTLEQVKSVWENVEPSEAIVKKTVRLGKKDILEFMVSKGFIFNLNVMNEAIFESTPDIVELVFDNLPKDMKEGCLYYACFASIRLQNLDLVKLCIRKGCYPDNYVWSAFMKNEVQYDQAGSIRYEQELVEILWNNSSEHDEALSFIEMASRVGYVDFIKLFIFLKDDEEIDIFESIRKDAEDSELFCNGHEMPFSEHERDDDCHSYGGVVDWLNENGL